MPDRLLGRSKRRGGLILLAIVLIVLLASSRYLAGLLIDYSWWSELRQIDTWWKLLWYGTLPLLLAIVLFFALFWTAFSLGIRQAADGPMLGFISRKQVKRIAALAAAILAFFVANATVDSWTLVRYVGGLRLTPAPGEYIDPIFGKPLHFYLFDLPFLNMLLAAVLTGLVLALLIYWLASHAQRIGRQIPSFQGTMNFEFPAVSLREVFDSAFVRMAAAVLLLAIAAKIYLGRYGLLLEDHGQHLVGVDWVADHIVLPLQWLLILGCVAGAALVVAKKPRWALVLLLLVPVRYIVPSAVAGLYVKPNELALEKPYIQYHIAATRSAYGLSQRVKETVLDTNPEIPIDYAKHKPLLDNVRLWDWQAFHLTISQIQPLRPYAFQDTDVDRYIIDGQLRQVLMAPRELDLAQVGDASSWINTHLIYTHGYGVVMAEANRITPDGLPVLFIKDAPPIVASKSLTFTEPEIYFSEIAHEPVFVDTTQQEFNYPSGSEDVHTTYHGAGGFSVSSPLMRLATALHYGDGNILLTDYLNAKSRMLIHRSVLKRLDTLAGFLSWDSDPYMVLTDAGRLVWMADGYMSSDAHPYSRELLLQGGTLNYMRNSVKATVDAYSGETTLYIFDEGDVLIQAYARLFPGLFKPMSAIPKDLRAHARYPETLFSVQAEIYRTFHMRDTETFYNRADLWDFSKAGQGEGTNAATPTYVVATLPGSEKPEFMLITTFTPAKKDNLIGVMYARCDGEHLGELMFGQLSKQNIIYGPMQIDARVNQDQNISKDLSLWDQRGSKVLRGQTLVLPIDNSFLYVEPIYIQSSQTSMPQLKKVALAMGNKLAYADTYELALAQLIDQVAGKPGVQALPPGGAAPAPTTTQTAPSPGAIETLNQVKDHLRRYRELSSQGKLSEAGRELEEIQKLVQK